MDCKNVYFWKISFSNQVCRFFNQKLLYLPKVRTASNFFSEQITDQFPQSKVLLNSRDVENEKLENSSFKNIFLFQGDQII